MDLKTVDLIGKSALKVGIKDQFFSGQNKKIQESVR